MTTSSVPPVVLRNDVEVEDPLNVVLVYIEAWHLDDGEPSRPRSFGESDLRLANRGRRTHLGSRDRGDPRAVPRDRARFMGDCCRRFACGTAEVGAGLTGVRILDLLIWSVQAVD